MKAAAFEYTRPGSLQEALRALRAHEGRAKLMAGGQSLGPMLNLRLARPPVVIDISGLAELRTRRDGGLRGRRRDPCRDRGWRARTAARHAVAAGGAGHRLPRHPQSRHAGRQPGACRSGGRLGADHGRPGRDAGDRRPGRVRMLPAQDYMQGAYTTGLREDELIAAVHVPEAGRRRAGATSFAARPANSPRPAAPRGSMPRRRRRGSRWARWTARPDCCPAGREHRAAGLGPGPRPARRRAGRRHAGQG